MSWVAFELLLLALGWVGVGMFRWYAHEKGIVDEPNERSSHQAITPRGAGIVFAGLWFGLLIALIYYRWIPLPVLWIFLPALLVSMIGFVDDCSMISSRIRLGVQIIAAYLSLYFIDFPALDFMGFHLPEWAGFSLLALGMLWMTNLMNFMDGIDGLAATQALFVFGVGGFILQMAGAHSLAILAFGLCPLLGGFLIWNWPLAKVFMGDSGSCFLGFLISLFALSSYKWFHIPLEIWIILTAFFWFDATVTLIRRILKREKFLEAHCNHAYQRLIKVGWTHTQVLLGAIVINGILANLALWAYREPRLLSIILGGSVGLVAVIYGLIEIVRPMHARWY